MKTIFRLMILFALFLLPAALCLASDPALLKLNSQPLANVLNPDGTLNLKAGFSGSLDPTGYRMILRPDGTPLFLPRAKPMANPPSVKGDESWSSQFILPGVNDQVLAIAVDGSNVYLGGYFSVAGSIYANCIVKWNGSSWENIGDLNYGSCLALAVDESNNLYAGGLFSTIGSVSAINIAKYSYSGSTWSWSALGEGTNNPVWAITTSGSDVYAGGMFSSPGNYIAKWNGSAWSTLGSGVSGGTVTAVYAIATSGSDVYAGGDFTTAGGSSANYIAKWSGGSWTALGSGTNSAVRALAVSESNVYAGGDFTSPGNHIARYNSTDGWQTLGSGVAGGNVNAIYVSVSNVYAGGAFTQAGGSGANYIAVYNGSTWSPLGDGTNSTVYAIAGSSIYVGGSFTTAGSLGASYIARWNGTSWENFGPGTANGVEKDGYINAITVGGSNFYVGGKFKAIGKVAANNVAKWNGLSWSALTHTDGENGTDGEVNAIAVLGSDVYVGGSFPSVANGISAQRIARFDGSAWSSVGTGIDAAGTVYAIGIVDGTHVYAGGKFSTAGGNSASNIAMWNGSAWSALGEGVSGGTTPTVYAIAVNGSSIFVGGKFTSPGNYIAKWDGGAWSALGSGTEGTDGIVYAIAMQGANVLAGGAFTNAGGSSAKHIAKWDGSNWSSIGSGTNEGADGTIYAVLTNGSDIYIGGLFSNAGTTAANNIAKWNGSAWSAYGSGTNGQVSAIGFGSLYIGGKFTTAGGKYSYYFAKYSDASASVLLETKIFLEGPYSTIDDAMTTLLNSGLAIPATSPYADARTVGTVPSDVTDWVYVELRTTPTGSTVTSRSAFLDKNGYVVDDDGTTKQITLAANEGDYYIIIRHRNHLAVMSSSAPHLIPESSTLYNFTTGTDKFYQGQAKQVDTSPIAYGMFTGDADGNGQVQNSDKNSYWRAQVGMSGYRSADFNLNAEVQNNDKNSYWRYNIGRGTQVP